MLLLNTFGSLLLILAAIPLAATAADKTSLYDSSNAKSLTTAQQAWFGPKSGSIKYDSRMIRAAQLASQRAYAHSTSRCWGYVKTALVQANAVESRPKTEFAKQAGDELQTTYGFHKIGISNPYLAPVGSVIVYGGRGAGHVEMRTPEGFVSDFTSLKPSSRPLLGIYVKPREG